MEKFLEYVTKDEICIPGDLLFEYGILSRHQGKNTESSEIVRMLKRNSYNDLLKDIDYHVR
jgi:hypothetical protein